MSKTELKEKQEYISPVIEIIRIAMEEGIAATSASVFPLTNVENTNDLISSIDHTSMEKHKTTFVEGIPGHTVSYLLPVIVR
ncbi:MAG: hypothetical protein LBE39_11905 [Flavobacteriaceae bacterium]|jgi:hypothetical protein|nr:hypothetical protein [Flavobacteriaceae bacterium]